MSDMPDYDHDIVLDITLSIFGGALFFFPPLLLAVVFGHELSTYVLRQ